MDGVFFPVLAAIFIVAPIGGIDAFYFHGIKYELYKHPDSRKEQVTHVVRALLLGGLMEGYKTFGQTHDVEAPPGA